MAMGKRREAARRAWMLRHYPCGADNRRERRLDRARAKAALRREARDA